MSSSRIGSDLRPICFVAMPFRKKKVLGATAQGAPAEIDCDALWDKAYRPAIEQAGYTPIRADLDTGSVIVKDMLERLAFADLVVADVSLQNGNVYYEIGLRHVAREKGCILFAADWSRQLFDIDQFTSVRYALADGSVPDSEADAIREQVRRGIVSLQDARTPWHEFIFGDINERMRRGVFHEFADQLSEFQASMRATRLVVDKNARKAKVLELIAGLTPFTLAIPDVAIETLYLVRDELGWQRTLDFVGSLPKAVAEIPVVKEQRVLALAEVGQTVEAIASLEKLIESRGETPERLGLIGGRYKRLWRAARKERVEAGSDSPSREEKRFLKQALDHYTRGMELDYNQYYCSSNIAQFLLARGGEGDAERAGIIDHLVVAACERAISRGEDDEWTRPTLLGAAFRAGEVHKARELAQRIDEEGVVIWKLKTMMADLSDAVERADHTPEGPALRGIFADLKELLPTTAAENH